MIRIGIVGSRRRDTYKDKAKIYIQLTNLLDELYLKDRINWYGNIELVSGGCQKGADRFAEEIAKDMKLPITIHYPDKSKLRPVLLKTNPREAYTEINYARNKLIAQDSDYLIACVAEDRKGGTEHTIKEFIRLGKGDKLILV